MRHMAKDRSQPLSEITFYCKQCCQSFKAEPGRVVDAPEHKHHPFAYFLACPKCDVECEQAHWERSLLKAWRNATGPKTEEGKAATAANLEGHPNKEEALRTRFNALKHGLSARTATYFPAKPDGYAFCKGCEVDRVLCKSQPACVKKTEIFLLHHAAFSQRNPVHLQGLYSDLHASLFALLQIMLQTIIADGPKLTTPEWYTDKDGACIIAEYTDAEGNRRIIPNVRDHPLLKPMMEMMSRAGLSLTDIGMTHRVLENEDAELGRLNDGSAVREESSDFQRRQVEALEGLAAVMQRAQTNKARDPVLLEHVSQNGGGA